MDFSLFILNRLTFHYQNSQGVVEDRFIGLRPSFFDFCTNGRRSYFGDQCCLVPDYQVRTGMIKSKID